MIDNLIKADHLKQSFSNINNMKIHVKMVWGVW
jgi:hypothetical protein